MKCYLRHLTLALLFFSFLPLQGQDYWIEKKKGSITQTKRSVIKLPRSYSLFELKTTTFKDLVSQSPMRGSAIPSQGVIIELPMADGSLKAFKVIEAPVFDEQLSSRFPNIKSFAGQGIDDPTEIMRFSISHKGFNGMLISAKNGNEYIEPYSDNGELYIVYKHKDRHREEPKFFCALRNAGNHKIDESNIRNNADDGTLRDFRLAVSTTGEYTQYHGGTVADALAAMNTSLTRVNGIYETDFNVTLTLINNTTSVIYTNPSTDPYSSSSGSWNSQLQSTLTSNIGEANYDVGHLLAQGPNSGNAGCIGCVCVNNQKGRGWTSRATPEGDPFDVDYLAHELGHQFGGNHTWTHGGNEGTNVQMEPGSGSTIMGYAGITGATDVQPNSDPYFHAISIQQVTNYIKTTSCQTDIATGNSVPVVNAGPNYTVPGGTPFILSGTATDADGDALTYCWEQMDENNSSTTYPNATNTTGVAFRSFEPTTSTDRMIPRLETVLTGATGWLWEVVPTVSRTLNFRFTVRDNVAGGGTNESDNMVVTVNGGTGPFVLNAPNTNLTWPAGTSQNVTWDVAGTAGAPVNASNVNILLSTDGGNTFPITLLNNTPNDGSQSVTVPNIVSTTCRVKVEAANNIFFDMSNTDFTINTPVPCTAETPTGFTTSSVGATTATLSWNATPGAANYDIRYRETGTSTWTTTNAGGTSTTLTGLNPLTEYEVQIRTVCPDNSTSSYSSSITFTTTEIPLNYCNSNGNNTSDEYIGNVTISNINNTTGASAGGYGDFTNLVAEITQDEVTSISITPVWTGTVYNEAYSVWIDYNKDGDFEDSGEQVFTQSPTQTTPINGSFTVPASSSLGTTRMRVSMKYNALPTPCESFTWGEVEDYTVNISAESCDIGGPCDDGDVCTTGDVYDSECNCAGTFADADGDGVCDADDVCPGGDDTQDEDGDGTPDACDSCNNNLEGTACDDGDACTTGDIYDANCNCAGTFADADGDGVCDADDICPGGDDTQDEDGDGTPDACDSCNNNLVGTACDDGDACTTGDIYDANCNCAGTFADADGDGVCDADDACPGSDDNQDEDGDGIPDGCDSCNNNLEGTACDDGDVCTTGDVYDANCNCVGTFQDADGDGVCDANDICPGGDDNQDEDGDGTPDACDSCNNNLEGTACDDGDACTTGDVYDDNCNCAGTFQDTDGDGVCDADDACPGSDDTEDEDGDGIPDGCDSCNNNLEGTACDDGDACTTGDVYDANCNCAGTFQDADGDGVCDADDACPGSDDNLDEDGDGIPDGCDTCNNNLEGTACDDGDACTTGDVYDANCNCAGTFQDADGDGVCDADDVCPGGDDNQDMDGDGIPDACDDCDESMIGMPCDDGDICTVGDVYDNNCNCVGIFQDADGDGVCDALDACPGSDDNQDADGDGIPDGCDACDNNLEGTPCDDGDACTTGDVYDANCNCVGTFADADGDGVCDADDICPGGDDNLDEDGDGTPDACDSCNNNLAGTACDDGDACTTGDTYDANCNCVGTFQDADGDGVCDADDVCPGSDDNQDADGDGIPDGCDACDNNLEGTPCDDGDVCTTGDVYDANCNCAGTFQDADGDGVCDADDVCSGGDDNLDEDGDGTPDACDSCNNNLEGTACDDGDACTTGDVYDANCNCAGTFTDSDGDGVCDADDVCPGSDDNQDADGDGIPDGCDTCDNNLEGTPCDDGDACTTGDVYDANCNCAGTFQDADGDGVCDADDVCPGGDDNLDEDGDGTPDACDSCNNNLEGTACDDGDACTTGDVYDANCNCAGTFTDSDGDGVCDADDICPGGDDNQDEDGDGTPDACDSCNNNLEGTACDDGDACTTGDVYDANCNCAGTFQDADGDGVCDADDQCPGSIGSVDGNGCVTGCTDPSAHNYNANAQIDDGSCETCTDGVLNGDETGVDCGGTLCAPCDATYCSSNGNNTNDEYIGNVTISNIDNTTGASSGGYGDFTNLVADIFVNQNTAITITPVWTGVIYPEAYSVWIDYNQDGDFEDAGEQVFTQTPTTATPISGSFVVPASALEGVTVMRVSMKYNGIPGPCESFTWGEVEDYSVNISSDGNPGCTDPNAHNFDPGAQIDDGSCETCDDGILNGDETDVDCGGTLCAPCGGCNYVILDSNNFESGWGLWNDGGSDCRRSSNDQAYANSGIFCVRLRDNTSTSTTTTDNLNLSSYEEIKVDFNFFPRSMDNSNEDLWLQISTNGGASYITVEDWRANIDFVNGTREFEEVVIPGPFTSNTRLRFRLDASGNSDWVYIDDVVISGCSNNASRGSEGEVPSITEEDKIGVSSLVLQPNPTRSEFNLVYKVGEESTSEMYILDVTGKLMLKQSYQNRPGQQMQRVDVSTLQSGIYYVTLITNNERITKRLVIVE
ncbi:MAG: GEVED domain-containing protein [Bacteroidota bacterium]